MGNAPTPVGPNDWVADRLAEIDQIADTPKQVVALLELEAELLPSCSEVWQSALEAALAIEGDPTAKAKALIAVALHLPQPEQHDVLQQARQGAEAIDDPNAKAKALIAITPHLPQPQQPDVLQQARRAAEAIKDGLEAKAKALIAIAPYLPQPQQHDVFQQARRAAEAVDDLENPTVKVMALVAIAPYLPESDQRAVLDDARTAAENIDDAVDKVMALSAVAPHLPESDQRAVLDDARKTTDKIQNANAKAHALSAIASCLPKSEQWVVLDHALTALDNIQDDFDKVRALNAIMPSLPKSETALLERVLATADNIQDASDKATALSAIAVCLPESEQRAVLDRALTAVDSIKEESVKAKVLGMIVPHLPKSETALLEYALTTADGIQNDFDKSQVLSAIAPRLAKSDTALLERTLTATGSIQNNSAKSQILSAIAPCLSKFDAALLDRALTATDSIIDSEYKAQALSAIAPRLPESNPILLNRVLTVADKIQNDHYKAQALSALAPHLAKSDPVWLDRIHKIVNQLQDEYKAEVLSTIMQYLPEPEQQAVLDSVLETTHKIQSDYYKAQSLIVFAPWLCKSGLMFLNRALKTAEKLQDKYKAQALSTIMLHLSAFEQQAVLDSVLEITDKIEDDYYKAQILSVIALPVPTSEQGVVPYYANKIQGNYDKAHILSMSLIRLPESEQGVILDSTLTAASNSRNTKALSTIAHQISLDNLKLFLEATFSLPDAAKCLASPAIRLTKDFLQLYPSNKHSTALNIVKHIPDEADKTKFLSALIPRLAVGLLPNALRLIQEEFKTDRYRTETLNNLVAYLPTDQTPDALNLIEQSIKNPYYQTAALVELIPLLPLECCKAVLGLLEAKIALPQYRASILQAIAKALTTPERTDKLASASSDTSPEVAQADETFLTAYQKMVGRTLNLTYQLQELKRDDFSYERAASSLFSQLAPVLKHLTEPDQAAMLEVVKALEDPGYQAAVLIALAPHFNHFVPSLLTTYTGDDYRNLLHIKIQLALTDSANSQALRLIADQLSNDKMPYIKSPYRNAEAWVELASHPAGKSHQTKALRVIQELQNNVYLQTQYLQRLIPHLAYQQRFEVVSIIDSISDEYHNASARVAIARKFPESEFIEAAQNSALALTSKAKNKTGKDKSDGSEEKNLSLFQVQTIQQLSTLAIDIPELLPSLIKLAETADTSKHLDRYGILVALAPHLPMRINREVKRTWSLSNTITDDLWDRALYLLARSYRDALTGGSLRNESAQDKDYLNLQDEIKALAQLLLMRDLEPPMAVGILGGWGGGKSYIMHLMQAQMTAIRSRKVDVDVEAWKANPNHEKLSPYVGHIYQIKFDAWTFAKSDLWASLMQTIFFELNRQISLEQELQVFFEKKGIDPYTVNSSYAGIWQALYKASDEDRNYFLHQALNLEDLNELKQGEDIQNRLNIAENLLWSKFGETKEQSLATLQEKRSELKSTETELSKSQATLEQRKLNLEADYQRSQQEFAQQFRKIPKSKLEKVINDTLGVSGLILTKRLGPEAFADLQQKIIQKLPEDVDIDNLQTFSTELRETVAKVLESSKEEDSFPFSWAAIRQWINKNLTFLLIFSLFALASIAMPILVAKINPTALVPQIVAFITPLLPAVAIAQKLWRSAQKWHDQARQALDDYEKQIATNSQRYVERETQEWLKQQQTQDRQAAIADLEQVVQELEAQRQKLQTTIQDIEKELPENLPASLADYITNRIQSGTYDKQLGLMHQVKQDLTNLSRRLLPPPMGSITTKEFEQRMQDLKKVFPRGPARVVVYIDDLDRCPPDRVVQVLEAVQLLVKTPLFIAVLAIDERYITRALEQFYKGVLLRHGSPSGTDYLEKIIQLPYRVRPIMADTLETYLRSQVVIQDNATGSTKFSEFSRQEFKMLVDCCQQVDLSPRTLKRLTNVYKLFKIVCRTRGTKTTPQVQQAILALLALSGRYPNLMRGVFETIETCFEEQRDKAKAHAMDCDNAKQLGIEISQLKLKTLHLDTPLKDFFIHCQLSTHDQYLGLELSKLQHDALRTDILPRTLTLKDISHEIFNLIRSFSFVGEIGEDPNDYQFNS